MKSIVWYWWILWVIAGFIQISVIPNFRIDDSAPNIIIIMLTIVGLLANRDYLAWEGVIFGGLLLDIFQSGRFGMITLTLFLIVFVMRHFRKHYTYEINGFMVLSGIIIAQLVYDLILITVNSLWVAGDIQIIIGDAVFSGFIGLILIGCSYLAWPRLFTSDNDN